MKYHTKEWVNRKFNHLTRNEKIKILYGALNYMKIYNGRTIKECIRLSMGYSWSSDGFYYRGES